MEWTFFLRKMEVEDNGQWRKIKSEFLRKMTMATLTISNKHINIQHTVIQFLLGNIGVIYVVGIC